MGCAGAREKIEDKMMLMKLERMEVQMEKEKELKKLADLEGHTIKRGHVPDYIDPKFAKEKQIYDDDDDDDEIGDKKTDDMTRKKGKSKSPSPKKSKKGKKGKSKKNSMDSKKKKKKQ